ncbi:PREDICTED: J domain-containing protein CG6693 [Rhagoletis zephyria]|uniref:J domain-containing protein CG6693 n=1 Tax=Rhagoletis zephyria TaxID=28612 RepID=UPI0008112DFB|nr:PREDICTED: J domain-containing protein CG6693 [Rhagoletis zephyria]
MGLLDLCEKYFGERDIYKMLELEKNALPKDIKKAYYKLSLQVHPDRVKDDDKSNATEKFKVLSKVYQVLSDNDRRGLYDEQGIIDEEDDITEGKLSSWLDLWRQMFKKLTVEDISNYEKSYVGSELERNDMKKAYLLGKGCINRIMNEVPFFNVKDEPRLQKIIREMIDAGEVPEYKIFTNEPAQKRQRRHTKYARESKEVEKINAKKEQENNLEKQIMERNQARESNFNSLMDKLMEKYGGEDDTDVFEIRQKKTTSKKKISSKKKETGTPSNVNGVRAGKVQKKRK